MPEAETSYGKGNRIVYNLLQGESKTWNEELSGLLRQDQQQG